jgi:uncharacterized protein (DUF2225 family)
MPKRNARSKKEKKRPQEFKCPICKQTVAKRKTVLTEHGRICKHHPGAQELADKFHTEHDTREIAEIVGNGKEEEREEEE